MCRYRIGETACKAFPDGIPEEILPGRVDHMEQYPGDREITFAIDEGKIKQERSER